MTSQLHRAAAFEALHTRPGMFLMPNPWDVASAKLLAGLGFEALATTSSGFAATGARADYQVTRDMTMDHIRKLAEATSLPLSADLENGFGHRPEDCAETIRLGAEAGLVGGSIEDFTGNPAEPQYPLEAAADRVRAAVEAARSLPFRFMLTARAENFFTGIPDLADTIRRLQAYQEAGADILYAPGLRSLADIRSVISSVDRPVNVLARPKALPVSLQDLQAAGVKRISLGPLLFNTAYGALVAAGTELLQTEGFGFAGLARSGDELIAMMAKA